MRFASLGSGSRGNATLVESGSTRVLVDCGFSFMQVEKRLAQLGCTVAELSAIIVTHEHSDHVRGVERLARKAALPVWMTAGTAEQSAIGNVQLELFSCHEPFEIRGLYVEPFPVPHDAREPSQFVFADGNRRLGILTDVGTPTPHIEKMLGGCDALLLECNHDEQMLRQGSYPQSLKRRVAGDHGHLSNDQAAALLTRIDCGRLQHIVAAHLSEENNTPRHAQRAVAQALGCEEAWITTAGQDFGFSWRQVI